METSPLSSYAYSKPPLIWSPTKFGSTKTGIYYWTQVLSWIPDSTSIKYYVCLIKFVLRCLCIEDGNRFMLSTEINNGPNLNYWSWQK